MARKRKSPYKRVEVEWVDAYSVDGWTDVEVLQNTIDAPPDHPERAVGFLVAENKKWLVIANTTAQDFDDTPIEQRKWRAAASMCIPRAGVIAIRELK